MPAKSIKSQALAKNSGPAVMSLKNVSTINHLHLELHHGGLRPGKCRSSLRPGTTGSARVPIHGISWSGY